METIIYLKVKEGCDDYINSRFITMHKDFEEKLNAEVRYLHENFTKLRTSLQIREQSLQENFEGILRDDIIQNEDSDPGEDNILCQPKNSLQDQNRLDMSTSVQRQIIEE